MDSLVTLMATMQKFQGSVPLVLCALLGAMGCDSESSSKATTSNSRIEVYSVWTTSGSERPLLGAADLFQTLHKGFEVITTPSQGGADQLRERFQQGAPPDLLHLHGGLDLCSWVSGGQAYIENLDAFAAQNGLTDPAIVPQAVQELGQCTGPDGLKHFYGVPVNIARANTLFYSKAIFAEAGIAAPPASIEAFIQIAEALKLAKPDVFPLALGTSPTTGGVWTFGLLLFEGIMAGMHGGEWYFRFYSGQADLTSPTTEDSQKLRAVLQAGADMLNYVNPDFQASGQDVAAGMFFSGKAAMMVTGDWLNGMLIEQEAAGNAVSEVFGGRSAFGDAFVMTTDVLALSAGAMNRAGGLEYLAFMASATGQDALNTLQGSIPPRIATQLASTYNAYAQGAALDFAAAGVGLVPAATLIGPEAYNNAIWDQLTTFQTDRNVDSLLLTIRNNYSKLKK